MMSPTGMSPTGWASPRSEEHTSELQSQFHLVCRLLLEKKKNTDILQFIYMHIMVLSLLGVKAATLATLYLCSEYYVIMPFFAATVITCFLASVRHQLSV